ncbi:DNA recombination protein RmuC [Francisella adeliensis]|uniref:DNA recombination protein RmuC n=1 Tax=Francisella adeliensis TaxID=2007306 RepID=A0A2Z4XX47_9GAMM|nr:DNA recombination protein RmuC [Francisella adeliensis]AXA33451.1 recombinase RmuC [Francisella adeliensis]MBK2085471.1 DNA recombination protein RmuC [Francisella adeliensis]MBK2097201.1 DNA recombination protein RmuC [Francisella adeliensis]QIW11679.1 DNA recombination protein RmuC [Francisella adeliensis]QIW13554.1 DNA recombination protein RmuC [Francisella adeliensis]
MIIIVGLIFVVVVLATVFLMMLSKKTKEVQNITKSFEEYKNTTQNELMQLRSKEVTFDTLLEQEKQKNIELKEDKAQRIEELKQELSLARSKVDNFIEEIKNYKSENSKLETQLKEQNIAMQDKLELLQNSEAKLKTEFENLANKIFESNSQKLNQKNQESLSNVLNPVREQLKDFRSRVDTIYEKDTAGRVELKHELQTLKELNQKMSEEAHNLTTALKGDKKQQGNWGEMVLEKVLESSGLRKGEEYLREFTLKADENTKFRPDVIIKLPENRDIIIDAKTSLVAYDNFIGAETELEKTKYTNEHINALKNHIDGLSLKEYEKLEGVNSLDFIFIFVPIENALTLALSKNIPNYDKNLYEYAFQKKIILVSPTTLLLALKVIENTWKYEKQAKSITAIYSRAEELYKKFVGFVEDLEKVGKSINDATKSYDNAFSKLKSGNGNLIGQAEKLKIVSNIKPKKEIKSDLVEIGLEDDK